MQYEFELNITREDKTYYYTVICDINQFFDIVKSYLFESDIKNVSIGIIRKVSKQ